MDPSFRARKIFIAAAFRAQTHKAEKNNAYKKIKSLENELQIADKIIDQLTDNNQINPRYAVSVQLKINQLRQRIQKLKDITNL